MPYSTFSKTNLPFSSVVTVPRAFLLVKSDSPSANSPITAPLKGSSDSPTLIPSILPLIFSLLILTVMTSLSVLTETGKVFSVRIYPSGDSISATIYFPYTMSLKINLPSFSVVTAARAFSAVNSDSPLANNPITAPARGSSDFPTLTPSIVPRIFSL